MAALLRGTRKGNRNQGGGHMTGHEKILCARAWPLTAHLPPEAPNPRPAHAPHTPVDPGKDPCVLSKTRSENIPEATQKVKRHKSEQQNKANLSAKETQSDYARCPRGHSRSSLVTEKKRRFHGPRPACW